MSFQSWLFSWLSCFDTWQQWFFLGFFCDFLNFNVLVVINIRCFIKFFNSMSIPPFSRFLVRLPVESIFRQNCSLSRLARFEPPNELAELYHIFPCVFVNYILYYNDHYCYFYLYYYYYYVLLQAVTAAAISSSWIERSTGNNIVILKYCISQLRNFSIRTVGIDSSMQLFLWDELNRLAKRTNKSCS